MRSQHEQREYQEEDPVNVQAAELMGKLHDRLKAIGYIGHPLEVYLVRLLFCLFAEDTSIFRKDAFRNYILNCTAEIGCELIWHEAKKDCSITMVHSCDVSDKTKWPELFAWYRQKTLIIKKVFKNRI